MTVLIAAIVASAQDAARSEPVTPCFGESGTGFRECQTRILDELNAYRADPNHLAPLMNGLKPHGVTQIIELGPSEDLFSKARQQGFTTLLQTEVATFSVAVTKDCRACVQAAILARLWDVRTGTLLYEKTLLRRCDEVTTRLSTLPRARLPFGAYSEAHVQDDQVAFRSVQSACNFTKSDFVGARDAAADMILGDFLPRTLAQMR